jgi:hypothetical protein
MYASNAGSEWPSVAFVLVMSPLYSAMCRKNAVREAEGILFNDTGLILAMSYRFYVVEKIAGWWRGRKTERALVFVNLPRSMNQPNFSVPENYKCVFER